MRLMKRDKLMRATEKWSILKKLQVLRGLKKNVNEIMIPRAKIVGNKIAFSFLYDLVNKIMVNIENSEQISDTQWLLLIQKVFLMLKKNIEIRNWRKF